MNLFIDTNVLLSFYQFSSDDLEELNKLAVLLEGEQVKLWLPAQVHDEFYRNREGTIAQSLKSLREQAFPKQFPQICRDYAEYVDLVKEVRAAQQKHVELLDLISADEASGALKADGVVNKLFRLAESVPVKPLLATDAERRMALGNPPGKKGSLGDAVIWLTLLQSVPSGEPLHFISGDRDYASPIDENRFDGYLLAEWKEEKGSKLNFYRKLSDFFREHYPHIKLASELEKELLISQLATSPNFLTTHSVVARLQTYGEFTAAEAADIVDAALSNTQVRWIAEDDDVRELLQDVLDAHQDALDVNDATLLQAVINGFTD